jgi:glyoxylate/hydroxypyruvate reductase A
MTILLNTPNDPTGEFQAYISVLERLAPERKLRIWPDTGPLDEIEYTLVWRPKPGDLRRYPNLKAIFNLGAGVDALLKDETLPDNVPLVRLVDESLTGGMTEYVVYHVLRFHRRTPEIEQSQRRSEWEPVLYPMTRDRKVGILGLGVLGGDAARKLVDLGFNVAGWSRRKSIPGVKSYGATAPRFSTAPRSWSACCRSPATPTASSMRGSLRSCRRVPASSMPGAAAMSCRTICWPRSIQARSAMRRSTCSRRAVAGRASVLDPSARHGNAA